MRRVAGVLSLLALCACRSPFHPLDESGPPEDPQKVGTGVHGWPLYERAPSRSGVRTDVLWPVASVRTADDGSFRSADLLVPFVLVASDGARSRFGIRPLFDVETDETPAGPVEDVDLLFPLVKWRDAPDRSQFDLRPFWFSGTRRKAATERAPASEEEWTYFIPFYGDWNRESGSGTFVWPFAGSSTDARGAERDWYASGLLIRDRDASKDLAGTRLVLGLVEDTTWDDGARWRAGPFVWHEEDASEERSETNVLWPGIVHSERKKGRRTDWVLPVWWHQEDADETTDVVAPFWYSHDGPEARTRVLFPFYGSHRDGTLERTLYGGPLWITTEDGDARSTDVLWPLFHGSSEPEGWSARAFPVLWLDRHGDRGHTHLWPLFGSEWTAERTESSVAWPFFTVTTDTSGWEAALPAPLVTIDRRGSEHETEIWPLLDHESDADDGSYEGDLLWLVSTWEGDAARSDFRVLWRLVQSTETADRSVLAINPLFRRESNARGDLHWSALFGLVARTRESDAVSWRLLWFLNV